ncbi:unnamed protein product, partial [Medioppia subpectinata]
MNGRPLRVEAPITGNPAPDVEWRFNGTSLDSRVANMSIDGNKVIVSVDSVDKPNDGLYTVTANNSEGSDEHSFRVTVNVEPLAPTLEVRLVDGADPTSGLELFCRPPANDGGQPITAYEFAKYDKQANAWKPVATVQCQGLADTSTCGRLKLTEPYDGNYSVAAINSVGKSPPVTVALERPPSPNNVTVVDNREKVVLEWVPPKSAGNTSAGSISGPITGYIVESKAATPADSPWVRRVKTPDATPRAIVTGVKPPEVHAYRVRTVNRIGISDPSKSTPNTPTVPTNNAPTIDKTSLKDINLDRGKPLRVVAPVTGGVPAPGVVWKINGTKLSDPRLANVSTVDNNSVLTVRAVDKRHEGLYTVSANNVAGMDEASFRVTVNVEPPAPKPLTVAPHNGTHRVLTCRAPPPNNARPVIGYVFEKYDNLTDSWSPAANVTCRVPDDSQCCRTPLTDTTGGVYSVRAVNSLGLSDRFVAQIPSDCPPRPKAFVMPMNVTQRAVHLVWESVEYSSPYIYQIEELDKGTGQWAPVANTTQTSHWVTNLGCESVHKYRLTVMGESCPSEPLYSQTIDTGSVRPDPPGGPLTVTNITKISVVVRWTASDCAKTYKVEKQRTGTTAWVPVGQTASTRVRVKNLLKNSMYKFRVRAVNSAGVESAPLESAVAQTLDEECAAFKSTPVGLEAVSVTAVGLELRWTGLNSPIDEPVVYMIQTQNVSTGKWADVSDLISDTRLQVDELDCGRDYRFRLRAKCGKCVTDWAQTLVTKTLAMAPSPPIGPAIASNLSEQGFTIKWGPPERTCGLPVQYTVHKLTNNTVDPRYIGDTTDTKHFIPSAEINYKQNFRFAIVATTSAGTSEHYTSYWLSGAQLRPAKPPTVPTGLLKVTVNGDKTTLTCKPPASNGGKPVLGYSFERRDDRSGDGPWKMVSVVECSPPDDPECCRTTVDTSGGTYRVKAMNVKGLSPPLEQQAPIAQPPGPPINVMAFLTVGDNLFALKWQPPANRWVDSWDTIVPPITNYLVEKQEVPDGRWTNHTLTLSPYEKLWALLDGLKPKQTYRLRIRAVNSAGAGEPCQ